MHYVTFDQKFVNAHIVKTDKIHWNAPIQGRLRGAATIQERPLMARVRYLERNFNSSLGPK